MRYKYDTINCFEAMMAMAMIDDGCLAVSYKRHIRLAVMQFAFPAIVLCDPTETTSKPWRQWVCVIAIANTSFTVPIYAKHHDGIQLKTSALISQ